MFSYTLASFNRRRRMKAESRQIPQKLAAKLKFVYCLCSPCQNYVAVVRLVKSK